MSTTNSSRSTKGLIQRFIGSDIDAVRLVVANLEAIKAANEIAPTLAENIDLFNEVLTLARQVEGWVEDLADVEALYDSFAESYAGNGEVFPIAPTSEGVLFYYDGPLYTQGLYIWYSTQTEIDTGQWKLVSERGPQGPQGAQGVQGPYGLTGDQGIEGPRGIQGQQGIQGAIGDTGPAGIQGETGSQGPQGFQGEVGPVGIGIQGPVGAEGPQGIEGIQGVIGETGDTGAAGPVGATGPTGPQGVQGVIGPRGEVGPQGVGIQGPQGEQGPVGVGIQGEQGEQGPTGSQGQTGVQGPTGATGATGLDGESFAIDKIGLIAELSDYDAEVEDFVFYASDYSVTANETPDDALFTSNGIQTRYPISFTPDGPQSLLVTVGGVPQSTNAYTIDIVGEDYTIVLNNAAFAGAKILVRELTISTGYGAIFIKASDATGDWYDPIPFGRGPRGNQGPQGVQGVAGVQGAIGDVGATGATGPQGIQGAQGIDGVQGPQGLAGEKGETGDQGPAGIVGPQGATGATGAQGSKGATGNVGAIGATGPQGEQGKQGNLGPTGSTGPQGPTGLRGPQGFQGDVGPQGQEGPGGDRGPTGVQGTEGERGPTGNQGPQGNIGATGPQGIQGDAGVTGARGTQGATGPTGARGSRGSTGARGATGYKGANGTNGVNGTDGADGRSSSAKLFTPTSNATHTVNLSADNAVWVLWQRVDVTNAQAFPRMLMISEIWGKVKINTTSTASFSATLQMKLVKLNGASSPGYSNTFSTSAYAKKYDDYNFLTEGKFSPMFIAVEAGSTDYYGIYVKGKFSGNLAQHGSVNIEVEGYGNTGNGTPSFLAHLIPESTELS